MKSPIAGLDQRSGLPALMQLVPSSLVVCPLRIMPAIILASGSRTLISVINARLMPPTPPGIEPQRHIRLAIPDAGDGEVPNRPADVALIEALLAAVLAWDQAAPLTMHCFAGLNRSPAAAFIALSALNPAVAAPILAHRLRAVSDTAAPHRTMVAQADSLLGRKGQMNGAIGLIGPGMPAAEGRPFAINARVGSPGDCKA